MNRDVHRAQHEPGAAATSAEQPGDEPPPTSTIPSSDLGVPEARSPRASTSRRTSTQAGARCGPTRSQISEQSFFLAMPDEAFVEGVRARSGSSHHGVGPLRPDQWETSHHLMPRDHDGPARPGGGRLGRRSRPRARPRSAGRRPRPLADALASIGPLPIIASPAAALPRDGGGARPRGGASSPSIDAGRRRDRLAGRSTPGSTRGRVAALGDAGHVVDARSAAARRGGRPCVDRGGGASTSTPWWSLALHRHQRRRRRRDRRRSRRLLRAGQLLVDRRRRRRRIVRRRRARPAGDDGGQVAVPALGEWSHTSFTQKIHFGTGVIDEVGADPARPRPAPGHARHHGGPRRVGRRRATRAVDGSGARVDLRRRAARTSRRPSSRTRSGRRTATASTAS